MAKEKDEKVSAERDREEKAETAREQAPPKKKRSKRIFVLVALLLLIGSAAGAYFFYGDRILEQYATKANAARLSTKKEAAMEPKKGVSGGPILTLDPFIFNLAGNSSRFAKVSLAISLQNANAFEEAKKIVPVLRDKALIVLSGKSAEELIDVTKRDSIKLELQNALKDLFKEKEDLESVYVTDIIIP
jgi:flagellar FliL protein